MINFRIFFSLVLLQTLGSEVLSMIPPFDVSRSAKCSSQCKLHTNKFIHSLKKFELWAFQSKYTINNNKYVIILSHFNVITFPSIPSMKK